LFYRAGNTIMAVDVQTRPAFEAGTPRELFSGPYDFTQVGNWDVLPDGHFVMVKADPATSRGFRVVFNWFAQLEADTVGGG
jgi:hypothetical protein